MREVFGPSLGFVESGLRLSDAVVGRDLLLRLARRCPAGDDLVLLSRNFNSGIRRVMRIVRVHTRMQDAIRFCV